MTDENDDENKKDGKKKNVMESSSRWLFSFWTTGWDAQCTFIFALLGFTFVAPTSHYWYEVLAKHRWTAGQSLTSISKRVFLDQFFWTPVFFVIWLASFWTLQDAAATAVTITNNSDTTTTTDTMSPTSDRVGKISSQLAQHLPEVMIAVGIHQPYVRLYNLILM
jgi:hypothetical protein